MKLVFLDTEYTGEHAHTTLVSVGMVTLDGKELYVTLNDYAREQVSAWLREHVLAFIDENQGVSVSQACERIEAFLEDYSAGEPVSLVSAGKAMDLIQVFQLWHTKCPDRKYFHFLYGLPSYLCHRAHFDLDTLFFAAGIDPNINRDEFVGGHGLGRRHHALDDARVVRECFLKLVREDRLPHLSTLASLV